MLGNDHNWAAFLGRAAGGVDTGALGRKLEGKTVAITGAGGLIGSALARALCRFAPRRLVLLDIVEHGLHELETELGDAPRDLVVGDVCDAALLRELFMGRRPDVVFHAAAAKHVWLMETNPLAAARTNVLGTRAALAAANEAGAAQFVLISTDKAVEPASMMGATKRIAELLVLGNAGPAQALAVRLGNVLGSTGSVVPALEREMARGGPLTITDRECTRYFFSLEEAVGVLLSGLLLEENDALAIPRAGAPQRVVDLAGFLVRSAGREPATVSFADTGLRPGERLHESMLARDESARTSSVSQLSLVEAGVVLAGISVGGIDAAVGARDVQALLRAIAEILPAYRPSPALLAYAEARPL